MRRLLAFTLLLSACASAPRPEAISRPPPPSTAAEDQPLVQSYELAQQRGLDELEHPLASGRGPDCAHVCELVANVCALSGRICTIAGRHEGEDAMDRACQDALDRCTRARADAAAATCTCGG